MLIWCSKTFIFDIITTFINTCPV